VSRATRNAWRNRRFAARAAGTFGGVLALIAVLWAVGTLRS
jgi:hypothetical protein